MTRREAIGRLAARLVPLYDPREARSIALAAAAGISGLTTTALLTDPGAELPPPSGSKPPPSGSPRGSRCNTCSERPGSAAARSSYARGC